MALLSMEDVFGSSLPVKKIQIADRSNSVLHPDTLEPVVSKAKGNLPADPRIVKIITDAADKWGVPHEYAFALAQQESGYDLQAKNNEFGASGLYQFIPATAKAHGIDPTDPAQAADAAMQDFSQQMRNKGVDFAIKNHFAGPDERLHGPKTAQYLADVQARAAKIREQLGTGGGSGNTGTVAPAKVAAPKLLSMNDVFGTSVKPKEEESQIPAFIKDTLTHPLEALSRITDPIDKGIYQDIPAFIKKQANGPKPTWHEVDTGRELTDAEATKQININASGGRLGPVRKIVQYVTPEDTDQVGGNPADKGRQDQGSTWSDLMTINPFERIANFSLPAQAAHAIAHDDEIQQAYVNQQTRIKQQEEILANPDKYPTVAVNAAAAAKAQRLKEATSTWQELGRMKDEAIKDPSHVAAMFANGLANDPELMAMPGGTLERLGIAVKDGTKLGKIISAVDAGLTTGTANAGLSAAQQAATGTGEVKAGPTGSAFAVGLVPGVAGHSIFGRADRPVTPRPTDLKEQLRTILETADAEAEAGAAKPQPEGAASPDSPQAPAEQPVSTEVPGGTEPLSEAQQQELQTLQSKPEGTRTFEDKVRLRQLQGGSVDRKLLARGAAVSAGVLAGYGLSDNENKLKGSIAGGLAGLFLPGGGEVLRRMKQSGAISPEGDILSMGADAARLIKNGLLKPAKDIAADRQADLALVERAKKGDQAAYAKLYNDNKAYMERVATKLVRDVGPKLGIDPSDIVAESFIKAFNPENLAKFKGDSAFSSWLYSIVRNEGLQAIREAKGAPETVSMDQPNKGGDETKPLSGNVVLKPRAESGSSPSYEDAAVELDTPENVAIRDEVNVQLVNAINKLSSKERQVVIKSQIELKPLEEIAKEIDIPLGTVKRIISYAKDKIEESIAKGYGAKRIRQSGQVDRRLLVGMMLAAGGTVALATLPPEKRLPVALTGALLVGLMGARLTRGSNGGMRGNQVGAIRNPFEGEWTKSTQLDLAEQLMVPALGNAHPRVEWATKAVKNYLAKHAGTETDPLKDIEIPGVVGGIETWGDAFDYSNNYKKVYGEENARIQAKKLGIPDNVDKPIFDTNYNPIYTYLKHVGDYLTMHVPVEKLQQYDLVRAVKETVAWDKEMAAKAAKAKVQSMKDMPVYKEYPDGTKWVQLTKPGEFAQESDVMGHSVRGYEPVSKNHYITDDAGDEFPGSGKAHPDWIPASGDSGHLDYGVGTGGWEAIKNGTARIYSLRSKDGMSHVTIEVEHFRDGGPTEITQIKGKGNAKPAAKYIPYIQDFVKNGKWDNVEDLQNVDLERASDYKPEVVQKLKQEFGDKKFYTQAEVDKVVREVSVGPKGQQGFVDQRLLKGIATAGVGAALGAYLDPHHRQWGALLGAGALLILRRNNRDIFSAVDHTVGVMSTRVRNKSEAVHFRIKEYFRVRNTVTHDLIAAGQPFLNAVHRLKKDELEVLSNEIRNGNNEVTDKLLDAIGDKELKASWKSMQAIIEHTGHKLFSLGMIKKEVPGYFPRIIKDKEGLFNEIGKVHASTIKGLLAKAQEDSIRNAQRPLTDIEEASIIDNAIKSFMRQEAPTSVRAGYTHARKFERIPDEYQKYYANLAEAYHSYIAQATKNIEIAKFFGKELVNKEEDGIVYPDVNASIGKYIQKELEAGNLNVDDVPEVTAMIKSTLINSEKGGNKLLQDFKNYTMASYIGNPLSAAAQITTPVVTTYLQGIRPTLEAVVRRITGKQLLSHRDFGLADHMSEEFVGTARSARFLRGALKWGLFKFGDLVDKDVKLNAAVIKAQRLAKSRKGVAVLYGKYYKSFGDRTAKLVNELKQKEIGEQTKALAYLELSRSDPIDAFEFSQFHADNPNGRLMLALKSYMIKQLDVSRRDAYNLIKQGRRARGLYNLTAIGLVLGLNGVAGQDIANFLLGRPITFSAADIPMNMLKTFGWSEYNSKQAFGPDKLKNGKPSSQKSKLFETVGEVIAPPVPWRAMDDLWNRDPHALSSIPVVGRFLAEHYAKKKKHD